MQPLINAAVSMFSTPLKTCGTVLSLIGMTLTVSSFQARSKKFFVILQTLGSTFFFISYFFLGGIFGAIINSYYLIRNFVFYKVDLGSSPKKAKTVCLCFCLGYLATFFIYTVAAGTALIPSLLNFLLVMASTAGTVGFLQSDPIKLRLWKYPDSICWLCYNVSCLSLGGILCEIFNLTSNTISLIRFRHKADRTG